MRIFLSYRRDDAAAWAGRLHDALAARFGQRNLWQDVTAVRPGENFSQAIDAALAESDVVVAVIGPRWLTAATSTGEPRLTRPDDYVRIELTAALAQGKQVIPVLVGDATIPTLAELPEGLEGLGLRQAVVLHDATWHQDVDGFIRSLRGESATPRWPRRWLIAAAIIALLLAAGLAGWLVLGRDGKEPENSDPGLGGSQPDSTVTEVTYTTVLESCTPTSEWTDLGVEGSEDVGPGWHFAVTEGRQHEEGSGHWDVVLTIEASQDHNDSSEFNYAAFYDLVADGEGYEPRCFANIGGQNPIPRGGSGEVLVGFELPDELTAAFVLGLDAYGEFGRIELEPTG